MANYSILEHSKTLGETQFQNFSTLTSTLAETKGAESMNSDVHRQRGRPGQRSATHLGESIFEGAEGCSSTLA
jgi:hypothetical protein